MKTGKAMGRLRRSARLAPLLLLLAAAAWWWWGSIAETLGLGCHSVPWRQYCVDGDVGAMAWSPDGRKLAVSLGFNVEVLVLDLESGHTLWHLRKDVFGEHSIAFTHDGKYVVTGTAEAERAVAGAALDLLDAETGRRVREVPGIYPHETWQANIGRKFAISPDGKLLAALSYDDLGRPATIYSTETWQEVRRVSHGKDYFASLAISPDSRELAIGTVRGNIDIFDLATGSLDRVTDGHDDVECLAFSPDGRFIVSGAFIASDHRADTGPVVIWRAEDGQKIWSHQASTKTVMDVAWSPDGRHIAWSALGGSVYLWDRSAPQGPAEIAHLERSSWAIAFSPDGRYLAIGERDRIVMRQVGQ